MASVRLARLMSQRGLCSRREADAWIEQGLVKVDGEMVTTLGTRVDPGCSITVEAEALRSQQRLVTVLLNKPVGYVSAQPEGRYRPASTLFTEANRYRKDDSGIRYRPTHRRGLAPAGRLDIDSQGLLVLTQDGRIARQLIGSGSTVEKEYLVRVEGTLSPKMIRRLEHGLELDGRPLKPATVKQLQPNLLNVVLIEGRKRQIRRMCSQLGLQVVGLKRVRIGRVRLAGLPQGQWRYLKSEECF